MRVRHVGHVERELNLSGNLPNLGPADSGYMYEA